MTTTILQPGQIEARASAIPELRLPCVDLFAARARRLDQLAEGHPLADWLRFGAALARAQQVAESGLQDPPMPDAELLARCREHAMPPLAYAGWRRDPVWQAVARQLAVAVAESAPAAARPALRELEKAPGDWLEIQADRLLSADIEQLDLATAPLIGAALQVYWTAMSRRLPAAEVARPEFPNLCPVCGAHPVGAVVRIGGAENGLRYLHCALCGSEWHVVRAKCSHCDNTQGLVYYSVEDGDGAVRAEACPECKSYLKLMQQDKDPQVDPLADDLATLGIDLLVSEEGYAKSGMNLWLVNVEE